MTKLLTAIFYVKTSVEQFSFSYVVFGKLVQVLTKKGMGLPGEGLLFVIVILVIVLFCFIIYCFNVTQKYHVRINNLETYNEQQREYFLQLLQKEQETRQFRHDIIDELLELKNYSEKGDYENLENYLTEMLGYISGISNRQYDVGNDIVNTVINYYFQPLQNKCRITVKGYMQEELHISQRDMCIVVSNLVKNAVEAVNGLKQNSGEIQFSVSQGKRYLNIRLENTIERDKKIIQNGLPDTIKADKRNHGLGLRSVRSIVKKYGGTYCKRIENQRYYVEIMLKI